MDNDSNHIKYMPFSEIGKLHKDDFQRKEKHAFGLGSDETNVGGDTGRLQGHSRFN